MRKLNFGCGADIREGYDNVDIQEDPRLFKSFDFDKYPYPFESNTYDVVVMRMIIEHLDRPDKALYELHRMCKPGAIIKIRTCFFNNIGMTNDMEHRHYFSHKTFEHFLIQTTRIHKREMFRIERMYLQPVGLGKYMPKFIREKLCLMIGGLIGNVDCYLKVIKDHKHNEM